MCGIVGYIGMKQAAPILLEGLKRLEYRGYDSSGVAIFDGQKICIVKTPGKIASLDQLMREQPLSGSVGIAHTRWATHGVPNEINAHPHTDCNGKIAVVHNGIIENFAVLRAVLEKEGHRFKSQTDSEVLAHLIEKHLPGRSLHDAVVVSLKQIEGTYGLVVLSADHPGELVAARKSSPLVIGIGKGEYVVASDASAIVEITKHVIYLDDNEVATITQAGHTITNSIGESGVDKKIEEIDWDLSQIAKGGFDTFMLKEIFEQPESIQNAMRGRVLADRGEVKLGGLESLSDRLPTISRIIIVACGTSWHAGLVGEFMFEELTGIPVEVEYASEFRYRKPVVGKDCLVIAISQSGETADTLAALKLAQEKGALTLGICNVVGSTIARSVDAGIYLHAGSEIGVASTKAFTSQLTVLAMLAVHIGNLKKVIDTSRAKELLTQLLLMPTLVKQMLEKNDEMLALAKNFKDSKNFLYLGRGYNYPVALEGALKLKEISYIHAEGYPAAEMKHGPIALIDASMPVVFLANRDATYEKIVSNIQEVKARGGRVIALATEGDDEIGKLVDHVVVVPATADMLTPIVNTIPLQLLAYHIARLKECDVDKPRNLAKSVTVE